jgi:CheY-like chemotaxis protein
MSEHQASDSRRETLRNWTIFCALIAAFEIAGVIAGNRFADGDGAGEEQFNVPTILLLENDGVDLYQEALQREGYVVIEAADPATALAHIQRDPPAAVVLGIKPGRSDELQILTRIHKLRPKLPVIVNATCSGCEGGIMNRSPDTYYTDSPSPDDVKRAVLSVLADSGVRGG